MRKIDRPKQRELKAIVRKFLTDAPAKVAALQTNRPDRHWNFKIETTGKRYLLRIENPLAVAQRGTCLADEAKIIRCFAPYNLAPKLITWGKFLGRKLLVESWVEGRHLPAKLNKRHIRNLVKFLAAVNKVPCRPIASSFLWKRDFLDVRERKRIAAARLRTGAKVPALRKIIQKIRPLLNSGLIELQKQIAGLPEKLLNEPVFVYRDITPSNILLADGRCVAVDWEKHSIGIADPSFSLTVFFRRFNLKPEARRFAIRLYKELRPTPHTERLIRARNLERILGEITWGFAWVARRLKLGFPRQTINREVKSTLKIIKEKTQELHSILGK